MEIDVTNDVLARLQEAANLQGKSVETYVEGVIQESVNIETPPTPPLDK